MRRSFASLFAIAALSLAAPAAANGKFPAAGQIVVDPGDPAHVVVRTTFGLLVSRDAGEAFDWICESGAGYGGSVDPGIAVTASGAVLAGIVGGISIGRADACAWQLAGGPVAGLPFVDVSVLKSNPKVAVALAATAAGNVVFRSDDDAATWAQAGAALPPTFQAITLDIAPSDPSRLYLSGLDTSGDGGAPTAAIARSNDGGATWEIRAISGASSRAPYLAAVDPKDAAVVYARLDGTPGTLLVSEDAGDTWATVLTFPGFIEGFALSPDGATVLAGGPNDGVWRASASDYAFTRVSSSAVRCLSWSGSDIYACGALWAVARSTDGGETFKPLLRLECLHGPLACDPATSVGAQCPAEWESIKVKIGTQYCSLFGGDAGAGGNGGAGEGGSGNAPPASGCGCRTNGEGEGAGSALLFGLALIACRRRRSARAASTAAR